MEDHAESMHVLHCGLNDSMKLCLVVFCTFLANVVDHPSIPYRKSIKAVAYVSMPF